MSAGVMAEAARASSKTHFSPDRRGRGARTLAAATFVSSSGGKLLAHARPALRGEALGKREGAEVMPHCKEALICSGEFWVVAVILVGFGFLLGGAPGAFVAVVIIVTGLVLSSIGAILDRIWSNRTVVD
jgi:hypothetical protein